MNTKRLILGIGLMIGGVAIAGYWWVVVAAAQAEQVFAYTNYWNAPIGTVSLAIVLTILTLGWFWAAWRFCWPKATKRPAPDGPEE